MSKKFSLPYVEFYITNVCNITCKGCNRFNSFKFKGWQDWKNFADIYEKWSQKFHFNHINILGGEPLLNPDYMDWVKGLRKLWPNSRLKTTTNGTQLHRFPFLYDLLLEDDRLALEVGIHNKRSKKEITDKVKNFLKAPFSYEFDHTPYRESLTITDSNRISIKIEYNWWFHQGAIITDQDSSKMTLHKSDPIKAHDICHSKTCHHFGHGRLYKCGASALFPEFDQQFNLDLSAEDRDLINSVNYLTVENSDSEIQSWLDSRLNPIPQCRFCPEIYIGEQIYSEEKKIFFQKNAGTLY